MGLKMKNDSQQKIEPQKADSKFKDLLHREEKWVFHHMSALKKRHQAAFAFIIFCGITFLWRGLWNLLDSYWFPRSPLFSSISCIIFGAIILFFTHELIRQLVGGGRFKK